MDYFISFIISVMAGIVSYFICKWLDGNKYDNQPTYCIIMMQEPPEAATSGGSFSIWIILFLCDSIISYVSSNYNRYSTRCIQFEDFFFSTNNATFVDVDLELTTNTLYSSATHLFLPMLRPFPVCVSLSSAPFSQPFLPLRPQMPHHQ